MTAKIFSKDLRLAAHPMMYVFALFGVMLVIPNYPYTVVFFYGLLGIFFTFLNGRENKDVYYCAVLPVTKRDQVRARAWLVVAVELAELVIAVPFAFLSARINPNGTNLAGIDANVALFGCVLLIYGVFNVVFRPCFYKTAIRCRASVSARGHPDDGAHGARRGAVPFSGRRAVSRCDRRGRSRCGQLPGTGRGAGGVCAAVVAGIPEGGQKLRAGRSVTGDLPEREKYAILEKQLV